MKKILSILLAAVLVFSLAALVACQDSTPITTETETETTAPAETPLDSAIEYIRQLYKDTTKTNMDYNVVTSVKVGDKSFTVTWTVDVETITVVDNEDGTATIDVPDKAEADIAYVLTATVADEEGKTKSTSFERVVPKFEVNTWEEYFAAESGEEGLVIEGIVVGIISKTVGATNNCIYLHDASGKGGYYVYGMAEDPVTMGIEVGMTVRAAGAKDVYNGTHELKPTAVEIMSTEKTPVDPIDVTEIYKNAEDLKAADLVNLQGALVTVKGVEIGDQPGNGYHNFTLAGKTSYIRISGSTCPISPADQATFTSTHAANNGNTADATGVVCVYSGNFYLVPVTVDGFSNFVEVTRTPAEMVEFEAAKLSIPTAVHMTSNIDLVLAGSKYTDVTITWTSNNACAVVTGNKLVVTLQDEAQTVELTATITCGTESKTVKFTIAVDAKPTTVPAVVDTPVAGTAYKFMLTQGNLGQNLFIDGTMNGFYYNTTTDFNEAIDVYVEVVEGGYKLYTMVGEDKTYLSIEGVGAADSSDGKEHVNIIYSTTVQTVYTWNTEYKTFTTEITGTDSKDGTYYIGTYNEYRTFSASLISKIGTSFVAHLVEMIDASACTHSYTGACDTKCDLCDAARTDTAAHTYDNACDAQCNVCTELREVPGHVYDNACDKTCNVCSATREVPEHVDAEPADGKCDVCDLDLAHTCVDADTNFKCDICDETMMPAADATLTIEQAIALGQLYEHNTFSTDKYFVVVTIGEVYNTTYGNMNIFVGETTFIIYGTYSADGETRYDALDAKPVAGETIKVYGIIGNYSGNSQMKNGWIVEYTPSHVHSFADATCTVPATCTCGATQGDALGHIDVDPVDNVCDRCEYDMTHVCADANGDFKCDGCETVMLPAADSTLTIEQAIALGQVMAHNNYTSGKYYVEGVIESVYNAEYGNMYLVDAAGNKLTIYGTYSEDGVTKYNALDVKPGAGETIKVYGIIGQYSGTSQMKNGWIVGAASHVHDFADATCNTPATCACGATDGDKLGHVDADPVDGNCDRCGTAMADTHTCVDANGDLVCDHAGCSEQVIPAADSILTIPHANALGATYKNSSSGVYTDVKYYIVARIKSIENATYGNMTLVDDDGNEFSLYGSYGADGSVQYGSLTEKPGIGDIIKVYGIIGAYYQNVQMKNGWITEFTVHTCDFKDADCNNPKTCKYCGATEGEKAGHIDENSDGICDVCSLSTSAEPVKVSTTVDDYANANNWTMSAGSSSGGQWQEMVLDDVTITIDAGDANSGKWYSGNWRIYQTGNPSIIFTAAEGKTIVSVKITYTVSNTGVLTQGGNNISSGTVVEVNANSITFGVGNTGSATNGQVRISAIEVIYQ